MIIKKSILSIIIAASIIILTTTPGLTYAQQPQNQTLTPAQQRHQELIELHAAQQQQQGQAPPLIPTTPQQQLPQAQTPTQPRTLPTPDWNPMVPGPIPTPPPTSDPDLIRFNELFAQCKAGQDYVVSGQANSYDHDN